MKNRNRGGQALTVRGARQNPRVLRATSASSALRPFFFFLAASLFAAPALAEPALWVAKQENATVYLFGTVHALKPELKWETPKIAKAFAECQEFWMEADDADPQTMQPLVAKLGIDRAHPLSKLVPPADLLRLDAAAKAAGLPGEQAIEQMRPWLAALTLAALPIVKAGYDPAKGADNVLKAKAEAAGKPVHGLETAEQQMHFFADLPQARQVEMLRSVLDEVESGTAQVEEIMAAWERADLAIIDKDMNQDEAEKYPDLHAVLIVDRNLAWAGQIADFLKFGRGVIFVAVGAGHLVGHDSLQEALKARGISVTRQ
jgi:uncharacterized protein YbaP (TraB family)